MASAVATQTLPSWVRRRTDPGARYGLRVTLFALAVVLVGIPFGFLLQQITASGPLVRIDTAAARTLHGHVVRHPAVIEVLRVISFLGGPIWFYLLVPAVTVF